jgi:hypothetical protein
LDKSAQPSLRKKVFEAISLRRLASNRLKLDKNIVKQHWEQGTDLADFFVCCFRQTHDGIW